MPEPLAWVESALDSIRQASEEMIADRTGLDRQRVEIRRAIADAYAKVVAETGAAVLETSQVAGIDHGRVVGILEERRYEALSSREVRYAGSRFDQIPFDALKGLLGAVPSAGRHFARACLARWHAVAGNPNSARIAELLAKYSSSLPCVITQCVTSSSLATLRAAEITGATLREVQPDHVSSWLADHEICQCV